MKKTIYTLVAIAMFGTTTAFANNHREAVSHHDSRHNVVVVEQPRHGGHNRGHHYVEPRHHGDVRVIRVNNHAPAPRTVVVERSHSNAAAGVIVGAAVLGAVIGALVN